MAQLVHRLLQGSTWYTLFWFVQHTEGQVEYILSKAGHGTKIGHLQLVKDKKQQACHELTLTA